MQSVPSSSQPVAAMRNNDQRPTGASLDTSARVLPQGLAMDGEFINKLESLTIEAVVEYKIARFLDQLGTLYPDELYSLMIGKVEKPLLNQILKRTGGNQVHAARILGINRNTLRKKMKIHGLRS